MSELVNREIDAGYHEIQFSPRMLSSGVYFYRIEAGGFVATKKFCLIH